MIEYALLPALIGTAAALMPKRKRNDKNKIKTIFKNINYGIGHGEDWEGPKFKKQLPILEGETEIGMRYVYTIPLGLPASRLAEMEKTMSYFSDGLNRPCLTEFRRIDEEDPAKYLIVSVFNKDIPSLFPYKNIPAPQKDNNGNVIGWDIPLGKTLEDIIWLDLDKIPHMTIAGVTRFGKTVFLKVLLTYLMEHHPEDARFFIFDLKGGLEFSQYEKLRQVEGVAGNYIETFILVSYLYNQMHSDLANFKRMGISNVVGSKVKTRRFIIVDEAAQLAAESFMTKKLADMPEMEPYLELLPEDMQKKGKLKDLLNMCQYYFSEIARIGGALGYRLIYCTQYPTADTLPRQIKMNSDAKVTFRLPTGYASEVAIDARGAEKLPSSIKGRALFKTHDLQEMQAPLLTDKEMWERLEKFQEPVRRGIKHVKPVPKEAQPPGGHSQHPGPPEIRDTGTTSNNPRVRF